MKERKVERKWCFWLFGWGWKRGEILVGPTNFLSSPSKTQSLQIGEKMRVKVGQKYLDKIAYIFFLLLLFFFFGQPQPGVINVACLLFFFFPFFLLGFTVSLDVDFFFLIFFYKYDDVHQCMNPWFTIVPVPFFFLERFFFLIL